MSNITYKVSGKADLTALEEAKRGLSSLGQSVGKIQDIFAAALPVLGLTGAVSGITAFGNACITEFMEGEKAAQKLSGALQGNKDRIADLGDFIDTFTAKTMASDDEVTSIVGSLAALGHSDIEIEKIMTAAQNLANVTGGDLNLTWQQANSLFDGTPGKLDKIIPELNSLTKAQLDSGVGIDIVNSKLKSMSDSMANSYSQRVKNLGQDLDNLKEGIGKNLAQYSSPVLGFIDSIIKKWGDAISEQNRYSDAMKKTAEERTDADNLAIAKDAQKKLQGDKISMLASAPIPAVNSRQWLSFAQQQGVKVDFPETEYKAYVQSILSKANDGEMSLLAQEKTLEVQIKNLEQKIANAKKTASTVKTDDGTVPTPTAITTGENVSWDTVALNANANIPPEALALKEFYANPDNFKSPAMMETFDDITARLTDASDLSNLFKVSWSDALEGIKSQFTSWADIASNITKTISDGMAKGLMAIGSALVKGKSAWSDLGSIAMDVLVSILQGIGAQLAGLAAIDIVTYRYGDAAIAAAGSAAAYLAAGAASAIGSQNSGSDDSSSSDTSTSSSSSSSGSGFSAVRDINIYVTVEGNIYGTGGIKELKAELDAETALATSYGR